jgi:hypothetical protein
MPIICRTPPKISSEYLFGFKAKHVPRLQAQSQLIGAETAAVTQKPGSSWVMAHLDTYQTLDQDSRPKHGSGLPSKALPGQHAAGWQQLQHIAAAQHIKDLSGLTPAQLQAIGDACCSLLVTGNDSSTPARDGPDRSSWSSERQEQLNLLLRAVGHAVAMYHAAEYEVQIVPAYPVLTSLLTVVSDTLEALFQGSSSGEASLVLLQQCGTSAATLQSPGAVKAVLQPALPLNCRDNTFDVEAAPGEVTWSLSLRSERDNSTVETLCAWHCCQQFVMSETPGVVQDLCGLNDTML